MAVNSSKTDIRIAVVGLGYVGLPLLVEFAKKYEVTGYDIDAKRIDDLKNGRDHTQQVKTEELLEPKFALTTRVTDLVDCTVFIITVPTPVDEFKKPDLRPLMLATSAIGKIIKPGSIIIYESTVYPGCTEEDCVPVIEAESGLVYNTGFFCGYSPERISPGDTIHTLKSIVKVTSGSDAKTAGFVDWLYSTIIDAGTHQAPSIKVAEASKAIENAQRDVNISFINELSLIFDKIGIDTSDVIEAASTKWNFLKFKPGLVGGHCIGVDPYYLAHKAESLGYLPQVILSGRRVNDYMGVFIVSKVMKLMIAKGCVLKQCRVLILGITFKENCPDIRNSRVIDMVNEFNQFGIKTDVFDPRANPSEVKKLYAIELVSDVYEQNYDAVILAVAHQEFEELDYGLIKKGNTVIFDTKSVIERQWVDSRL